MSGSASLDLERQMLQHTLAIAPMPTLSRVYVALCETAPTEAAGGSELAGGGYARTAATFALLSTPANAAANATAVDFAPATGDWQTIGYFELWTAATGGTRLYWGQLVDPADGAPIEIDVLSGSAVRFSPGSLVVQAAETSAVGIGPFLPTAGGEMTGPLDYTATGGTTVRAAQDRAADVANVLDHGADPTGVADSTAAFRHAIATLKTVYLPKGNYIVTDRLALISGQTMYGDGRGASVLRVYGGGGAFPQFNLSALGVVSLGGFSDYGASVRDFGIVFTQPDTAVRASLVAFPPAFYAAETPRFMINRVRVTGANIGLNATGNSGGPFITDFECSAFTTGMMFDNARDVVHIRGFHFWDFGIAPASGLSTIFKDGTTLAATFGRVDGLEIDGFFAIYAGVRFLPDPTYSLGVSGYIVNMALDGGARLICNGPGAVRFSNLSVSSSGNHASVGQPALSLTDGIAMISNLRFQTGSFQSVPAVQVSGTGELQINGGDLSALNPAVSAVTAAGAHCRIKNVRFRPAASAYTAAYIAQTAGAIVVSNCDFGSGGSGVGISVAMDLASNRIDSNQMVAWTTTLPAVASPLGLYAFNGVPAASRITVTGSRGGNAAVASLLTSLARAGLITDSSSA